MGVEWARFFDEDRAHFTPTTGVAARVRDTGGMPSSSRGPAVPSDRSSDPFADRRAARGGRRTTRRQGGRATRQSARVDPRPEVEVELEVGPVAHGGHCVARYDGRVVFVRHTLPGEQVRARVTEGGDAAKFWRADAVEILEASPDRVPSVWPEAGPGGVGGGELAHVALDAQRRWKRDVLAEQLPPAREGRPRRG